MTRIGITGHQRLPDPAAWQWAAEVLSRELDSAPTPLLIVTSLAVGADQLLAQLGEARGAKVHAVLPFPDIERTFAAEDLPEYRKLLRHASVEVLNTPGTDEDAYLAAGRRVVEIADVLIAIWDGLPAKGKGGTADIVQYAIASGCPIIHVNPLDRSVTSIPPAKEST
jgi:hypothetical protein